jgi:hypothetical protein
MGRQRGSGTRREHAGSEADGVAHRGPATVLYGTARTVML